MTKYNLHIDIAEVNSNNPAREDSVLDCKGISARDVYAILRLTLEKWVRILDDETESNR